MMFDFIKPYMLIIQIVGALIALGGGAYAGHRVAEHWRDQGREEIQAKFDKYKTDQASAEDIAIAKRNSDNIKQLAANELINQGIKNEYEKLLAAQSVSHAAVIADIRAHGGLRVRTDTTCSGSAGKAGTTSTGGDNETGTTRLPEQIESDLFNYAKDRDEEIIQLQSCQKWIRSNGFYK